MQSGNFFICLRFMLTVFKHIKYLKIEDTHEAQYIHLECFAMRKDLLTEKTKCQVLFCQRYW